MVTLGSTGSPLDKNFEVPNGNLIIYCDEVVGFIQLSVENESLELFLMNANC